MSETVTSPETTLTSQEVVAWTKKLNYGTWKYQKSWNPLHVVDAEGCSAARQGEVLRLHVSAIGAGAYFRIRA